MAWDQAAFLEAIRRRWPDKMARLTDGFYSIKDKAGRQIPFRMNEDQAKFIAERHGLDVILKARQRGFTTVIQLDMLDDCLFTPNLSAGVIAHSLVDAKAFFKDKIKFAYDNLPREFQRWCRLRATARTASASAMGRASASACRCVQAPSSGSMCRSTASYAPSTLTAPRR
jgi:hypothetical protein